METEKWEIDPLDMSLDDLEILQQGFNPGSDISQLKDILGRLVTNKTAAEIGKLSVRQVQQCIEAATSEIEALALPKPNETA